MPIPQDLFFLVGWASCPSHELMKRIFARGLFRHSPKTAKNPVFYILGVARNRVFSKHIDTPPKNCEKPGFLSRSASINPQPSAEPQQ